MIRAIMLDVDGVLVRHPDPRGWSVALEDDLGIAPAMLQDAFFAVHWDDIIHGRASLRERLEPVLRTIAPTVPYATLVAYWFGHDAHLDTSLLSEVDAIRAGGTPVHLATVQEHERARFLWEDLDFRSRFDGLHYAADLGCAKPDARFYRSIEARTGFRPDALFFVDDKIANVAAAIACGWAAAHWTGRETLHAAIERRAFHR